MRVTHVPIARLPLSITKALLTDKRGGERNSIFPQGLEPPFQNFWFSLNTSNKPWNDIVVYQMLWRANCLLFMTRRRKIDNFPWRNRFSGEWGMTLKICNFQIWPLDHHRETCARMKIVLDTKIYFNFLRIFLHFKFFRRSFFFFLGVMYKLRMQGYSMKTCINIHFL